MTPSEYEQLQQIFLQLREANQADRQSRIQELDAKAPKLAMQLRQLLTSDEVTDDFLASPIARPPDWDDIETQELHSDSGATALLPKTIGAYRVLQKIGEGGYGVVFMAEQLQPIRRRVAIKWIKPGMDSQMVLARFEAERQALAMMQHPSIANVIEANTTPEGRPFFVMELVHGHPIDKFCADNKLDLEERLTLFLQVCEAVHHAHRKGILHRDIKPANVLVTLNAGRPLAKVIDFGIAKALHMPLTDRTMFTEYGQIIGTLEYMSPEQAVLSENGTDVRSDVYSLGVLLYLLLTDATPISRQELLSEGIWEIKKTMQDSTPQTPSRRVTTGIESQRWRDQQTSPPNWLSKLRGELDWITMKALEKDPDSRYDSAADLAQDLQRFLNDEAVEARPPSFAYSLSKWLRRHRVTASVALILAASLVFTLAALSFAYVKSQHSLRLADAAIRQSEKAAEERAVALEESDQQRRRADENAANLAKLVKRSLLENSWNEAIRGRKANAAELLAQIPNSQRDFEWQLVDRLSGQVNQPILRSSDQGSLRASCVHSSLGLLAVLTTESVLEIWNLRTQTHQTIQLEQQLISNAAFSRDGSHLLLGGGGDLLQLIRLEDLTVITKRNLGLGGIRDIAVQPGTRNWMIATGADYLLQLSPTLETLQQRKLPSRVSSLTWLNDQSLAIGLVNGKILLVSESFSDLEQRDICDNAISKLLSVRDELWALDSKQDLWQVDFAADKPPILAESDVSDFSVSTAMLNEEKLFISQENGHVALLNTNTAEATPISQHAESLDKLLFTNSTRQLIGIHVNGRVDLINTEAIQRAVGLSKALVGVTDAMPLSQSQIATGHANGAIKIWQFETGNQLALISAHDREVYHLTEGPQAIASTGADNSMVLTDLATHQVLKRWQIDWGVRCVQFLNNGQQLAGPPDQDNTQDLREGTFDIWDVTQEHAIGRCVGHTNWIVDMVPVGEHQLLTNSVDGLVKLWDTTSGQCLETFDKSQLADSTCMAYCPTSNQMLLGHQDGSVTSWNLDSGQMKRRIVLRDEVLGICANNKSARALVAGRNSPLLTSIDTSTLTPKLNLNIGIGKLINFRTSDDGNTLLLRCEDNAVRIWKLP